jgi:putative endonuclease
MYHVYLLQCEDGSIYTGITNDLKRRLEQHKKGKGGAYTASHKAKEMIHTEIFGTKGEALKREAEIKRWPRKEKIALAERTNGDI